MIKLQLHENWQLCNIRQLDWIPAQIPGDIYAALLKTGKMPDPFFGDNEYQAKALMELVCLIRSLRKTALKQQLNNF